MKNKVGSWMLIGLCGFFCACSLIFESETPDVGQTDEGTADEGATDEGTAGDTLNCDDDFSGVEAYMRCPTFEQPGECAFNVTLNGSTCKSLCESFEGISCVNSINNPAGSCSSLDNNNRGCEFMADDNICICALSN